MRKREYIYIYNRERERERQAADDNVIRRMCFACSIPKATNTHS